jgi:chromosome partitioning protein
MQTIAVANMKGGVGKTSLAIHLAVGLAKQKAKTLLIDLDPQANATAWLMGLDENTGLSTAAALREGRINGPMWSSADRGPLDLLASTPDLAGIDHVLAAEVAGETILRRALERRKNEWDYVIVDCPPNLGLSVLNALCAADHVVAPVLGAFLSLTGLRRLEDTCEHLRDRLNAKTRVLGYVLFGADTRESITDETREILHKEAKGKLFRSEVRISTAAKSMPARRQTAWDGGDPRGLEDYRRLIKELEQRIGAKRAVKEVA